MSLCWTFLRVLLPLFLFLLFPPLKQTSHRVRMPQSLQRHLVLSQTRLGQHVAESEPETPMLSQLHRSSSHLQLPPLNPLHQRNLFLQGLWQRLLWVRHRQRQAVH